MISIITVTLNDLPNLKKTFYSLMDQTCKDFEWIIKDGGSTDETEKFYLSEIKNSLLNVFFVIEGDISLYDAMNQSLKHINGDYTLFLNAGDILASKDTIRLFFKSIKHYDDKFSFIYGDNVDITGDGIEIYKKARNLNYLNHSLPTSHQAIFYDSGLFKIFKYSTNYLIAADYELTAQIYFNGYNTYLKLDFPICIFYLGGISQNRRKVLLKEGFNIHKEIVGNSWILAHYKYLKRVFTFFIIDNYPQIYKILRKGIDKKYSVH